MNTQANSVFNKIEAKRKRPWQGEEEVRVAWIQALEDALGIHFDVERKRYDCRHRNIIIEFKRPGLFFGSKNSSGFKNATEKRLLPYILKEAKSGIPCDDFIGIAIDGEHICFAKVSGGTVHTQSMMPFSENAVGLVIRAINDAQRYITIDDLMLDFGHGSHTAKDLMQSMADALSDELAMPSNSKIKMLFEEWRTLYGQVAGMSVLQSDAIDAEMCFSWKGNVAESLSGRLFVIHTYNSLLIKLLAAEIVSAYGLTTTKQPAHTMASLQKDADLLDALSQDIEQSGIFKQACINGFVEEVIFSWYLDAACTARHSTPLIRALRGLLGVLSLYRADHLPHTRDVLRDLYQGLVPGKLRQSLGEFYTPDWLVDFTLTKAKKGPWLNKRILDPTCGSGAFLLSAIRLVRKEADKAQWNAAKQIDHLCSSIWGFDLNPLAVQTARVNFLMEIADLLRAVPGHAIEIPVLLADAIYSPAPDPEDGQHVVNYKIGSQVAGLDINLPSILALNRIRLDQVFIQMGECVENDMEYANAQSTLLSAGLITPEEAAAWFEPLQYTYNQILELHRQQWNGIWFRIVRNFFWSATAGHFDCIIGNPPWVRWSKLPDAYRERVKPTCEQYNIFSENKRHGGNELDISAMITYTTADKWLQTNGRLAFVIRGELFKNPSSSGFRKFKLKSGMDDSHYLKPIGVDDLRALKPFEDASNHTVVVVFSKSRKAGKYPVPYRRWDSVVGESKSIPAKLGLKSVRDRITTTDMEATPVGDVGSPWAVLAKGRFGFLKAMGKKCLWYSGHKGITSDLNGLYFVPITANNGTLVKVRSRPEAGEKPVGEKEAWVEPTLLYPLIKGARDFEPCYLRLSNPQFNADELLYTFLPNKGIAKEDYSNAESVMNRHHGSLLKGMTHHP